jgi:hypothetical protein
MRNEKKNSEYKEVLMQEKGPQAERSSNKRGNFSG